MTKGSSFDPLGNHSERGRGYSPLADSLVSGMPHPLEYRTKSELVYQRLREMIVNGQLQTGDHLYLDELATRLGVSANPVREALRRLESEGLVVSRPHAGTVVGGIDVEKLGLHFLIRGVLEGLAVRLACSHITEADLERLREYDRQLRELAEAEDFTSWNRLNLTFYRMLFDCSHSAELVEMIDLQRDRTPRYHHFPEVLAERSRASTADREHLLAAVAAGDGERAERIQRDSVARMGEVLIAELRRARSNGGRSGAAKDSSGTDGVRVSRSRSLGSRWSDVEGAVGRP